MVVAVIAHLDAPTAAPETAIGIAKAVLDV